MYVGLRAVVSGLMAIVVVIVGGKSIGVVVTSHRGGQYDNVIGGRHVSRARAPPAPPVSRARVGSDNRKPK